MFYFHKIKHFVKKYNKLKKNSTKFIITIICAKIITITFCAKTIYKIFFDFDKVKTKNNFFLILCFTLIKIKYFAQKYDLLKKNSTK